MFAVEAKILLMTHLIVVLHIDNNVDDNDIGRPTRRDRMIHHTGKIPTWQDCVHAHLVYDGWVSRVPSTLVQVRC